MRCRTVLFVCMLFGGIACLPDRNIVKIKGSDTEVNLAVMLAEAFGKQHPEMRLSVSGGGSGLGIASLMNGNAHLANSSRGLKAEELKMFADKHHQIDSFVFAQDAIAFVVSDKMPFDTLHVPELAKILSGETANWKALGGPDRKITLYGRQSNSGTYEYVRKQLGIHFSPNARQMSGNAQILESIKTDPSGIGYVSAGYLLNGNLQGMKALYVSGNSGAAISPLDEAAINSRRYAFQRPLFQFYKKEDSLRVAPFLAFEKTAAGQAIIRHSGYYPVLP